MIIVTLIGNDCNLLHFALVNSNTSGFFLCGMMLEPVVQSAGNFTKPKFCELNMHASNANFANVPAMLAIENATLRSVLPRPIWAYTTL